MWQIEFAPSDQYARQFGVGPDYRIRWPKRYRFKWQARRSIHQARGKSNPRSWYRIVRPR